MISILLFFLLGFIIGRIRQKTLMRDGEKYLIRTTLFTCPWFSMKIHKALMSDPACPHDHPWNYLSFILWGGYHEVYEEQNNLSHYKLFHRKWHGPGSVLYRRGDKLHKLEIPKGKYCVSFIITFKKWREWGFYDLYEGWVSHKQRKAY